MQSKALMQKLWKKHIVPLEKRYGGGAKLFEDGFVYQDELKDYPILEQRGDTLIILQPGQEYIGGELIYTRNSGHWVCLTLKSKALIYFDPLIVDNGIPSEIRAYLDRFPGTVIIDQSSPQTGFSNNRKAYSSCGLFCIKFLKSQFS
jgi:hypothetical protein